MVERLSSNQKVLSSILNEGFSTVCLSGLRSQIANPVIVVDDLNKS